MSRRPVVAAASALASSFSNGVPSLSSERNSSTTSSPSLPVRWEAEVSEAEEEDASDHRTTRLRSLVRHSRSFRRPLLPILLAALLAVISGRLYAKLLLFGPTWYGPLPSPGRVGELLASAGDARSGGAGADLVVGGGDARSLWNVRAAESAIAAAERAIFAAERNRRSGEEVVVDASEADVDWAVGANEAVAAVEGSAPGGVVAEGVMVEEEGAEGEDGLGSDSKGDEGEGTVGSDPDAARNKADEEERKDVGTDESESSASTTRRQRLLARRKSRRRKRLTPEQKKERLGGAVPFLVAMAGVTLLRGCAALLHGWYSDDENVGDGDGMGRIVRLGGRRSRGRSGSRDASAGGAAGLGPLPAAAGGIFAAASRHRRRLGREIVRELYRARSRALFERLNAARMSNGQRPISADSLRLALSDRNFGSDDYEGLLRFDEENGSAAGGILRSVGMTEDEIVRCPERILGAEDDLMKGCTVGSIGGNGGGGSGEEGPRSCAVCLERYEIGDAVRTIPCFHSFHTKCIDPWLRQKAECPVCKHHAI